LCGVPFSGDSDARLALTSLQSFSPDQVYIPAMKRPLAGTGQARFNQLAFSTETASLALRLRTCYAVVMQ
jgi:hypothetical protein